MYHTCTYPASKGMTVIHTSIEYVVHPEYLRVTWLQDYLKLCSSHVMNALSKFDELQGDVITISDTKISFNLAIHRYFIIIHTAVNIPEQCTQGNVILQMIQGQTDR